MPGSLPVAADDQGWQSRGTFGYLNDPRYAALAPVEVRSFDNFYSGQAGQLPNVVFPTLSVAKDYPDAYKNLSENVAYQQCVDSTSLPYGSTQANCDSAGWRSGHTFVPLVYDEDPKNIGRHSEDTQAVYGTLRFGFDDWKVPVEGNVGLRVVRSTAVAHGHEIFKTELQQPDAAGSAALRYLRASDREGPLLREGPAVAEPEGGL